MTDEAINSNDAILIEDEESVINAQYDPMLEQINQMSDVDYALYVINIYDMLLVQEFKTKVKAPIINKQIIPSDGIDVSDLLYI